ncbi:hypothetical protein M408DRAFT_154742 [Serendipita vermifera MAFF 305830]|uniref:Protein kinase domain-containing protein n=1 Tax=Serendipita vermifera MAFF 305830 TaxID=933852 RepID=A0A0C3BMY2_SERVB|nr:hypothetical protein M408DRAFT_154742 [Serendipita vermifera MAFF 305830]
MSEHSPQRAQPNMHLPQIGAINFSKRIIQGILRRPKRDSETSEVSIISSETKSAPGSATSPVETVSIPIAILAEEDRRTASPPQQMKPLPVEEPIPTTITIDRVPSPPRLEGEEEDENEPPLLAPEVIVDPNLPSILNPPVGRRTPVNNGGSFPKALRFELAQAPERSNPNYRRLSAVAPSSQWRVLPFGSLNSGNSPILRTNVPVTTTGTQESEGIFEKPTVQSMDHFLGTRNGFGYPVPFLPASEVAAELRPFTDDNRPASLRNLSGEVRQIGLHATFEGNYSNVFKGIWNGTLVSIKVIRGVGVSQPVLAKIREQREAWWHLQHPNVLSLYGFSDEFGSYGASISPWLKNGSAGTHLRRNPVKPTQRFQLWCDVVEGLAYLHTRNPPVVHGDLKPANVLMDDNGTGILCDFGLVHIVSDEVATGMTTTTNQTGTVRYLACELVNSDDMPDPTMASDIYSLGCLGLEVGFFFYTSSSLKPFLQFLFLRSPFANRRTPAQIFRDIASNVPPAPHIPFAGEPPVPVERYWRMLTQCWNPEPEQRPNATQVRDYLHESKSQLVAILEDDNFVPAPGLILDEPETTPAKGISNAPIYRSPAGTNS